MIDHFRDAVARSLESEDVLAASLRQMTTQDWKAVAELFSAKLPEFDAVYAMPGAGAIAEQVASNRGIVRLSEDGFAAPAGSPAGSNELVIFTAQLVNGQAEAEVAAQAQAAGWKVLLVATAVERTNKGGRTLLAELDIPVRAVTQVADTPRGLVFERRAPDRWMT